MAGPAANEDKVEWQDPDIGEPIDHLWGEYHYRHSHIWQLTMQITAAVVALGIVPHLDTDRTDSVEILVNIPPIIALFLASFGIHRMYREFRLFSPVKEEYLRRTGRAREKKSVIRFKTEAIGYLALLWAGACTNAIFVLCCRW